MTPVRTGPCPTTSGRRRGSSVAWPTRTPATSVIALAGPGVAHGRCDPEVRRSHAASRCSRRRGAPIRPSRPVGRLSSPGDPRRRREPSPPTRHPPVVRLEPLPESPPPARSTSPRPSATCPAWRCSRAPDPAGTRAGRTSPRTRSRSSTGRPPAPTRSLSPVASWPASTPTRRSIGGRRAAVPRRARRVPRLRPRARPRAPARRSPADDQGLPPLRLALHDWDVAWDRRTGRPGSAAGRSTATVDRLAAAWTTSVTGSGRPATARRVVAGRRSEPRRDRCASARADRAAYEAGVEAVRARIAQGDIYQANLTRRLEAPFDGDPWPPTAGCGPATRRSSRRTSILGRAGHARDRPPAGAPVRVARAVPRARPRTASSRPTRSRARGRAAATAPRTGRSPASSSRAPRTGPRTS